MFIVLSGILNLGNVVFEMDENEGAFVKDTQGALAIASVSYYWQPGLLSDAYDGNENGPISCTEKCDM